MREYNLIYEKNSSGIYEYDDFIRPTDEPISVVKKEIREAVALHKLDEQVAQALDNFAKKNHNISQYMYHKDTKHIAVNILWDEEKNTLSEIKGVGIF